VTVVSSVQTLMTVVNLKMKLEFYLNKLMTLTITLLIITILLTVNIYSISFPTVISTVIMLLNSTKSFSAYKTLKMNGELLTANVSVTFIVKPHQDQKFYVLNLGLVPKLKLLL